MMNVNVVKDLQDMEIFHVHQFVEMGLWFQEKNVMEGEGVVGSVNVYQGGIHQVQALETVCHSVEMGL